MTVCSYYIIYLVEQPSIWEKYQMIIMIIALILAVIVILSLLLYFFPDHRRNTIGKDDEMHKVIVVILCLVNVFWVSIMIIPNVLPMEYYL